MISKDTKVAVLYGGMSTERKVSLKSGAAVLDALRSRGWDAVGVDVGPDLPAQLIESGAEVAWLALHGSFGEDGCVQGLLEIMRIPYTGSSVKASAAAMDKITTKRLLRDTSIAMPADEVWRPGEPAPMSAPAVAKTPEGGSTLGVTICQTDAELSAALDALAEMGSEVLIEELVEGTEITVAVLDGEALPVVAILPESGFFDFEAKYTKGKTRYEVPAPIPDATAEQAQAWAALAYAQLGLSGIARADFIVRADGTPVFLEINTIPGMTATSLSPMAAGAVGISFEALVERVLLGARLHLADRRS